MDIFAKPWAFVRKDFTASASYKLSFLMQFFSIFISASMFFFISRLLGGTMNPYLKKYGGDYFSYVIIGVAFGDYLGLALKSMTETIRSGQVAGTLEALLATPTRIPTIIVSSSLYSFIWTSLRVVVYLVLGSLVFDLQIQQANYLGGLIVLILTILAFSSFGILSASFIMVLKRGDPFTWIFTTLSGLVGGVYYPITVLPQWLQIVSRYLPITYSLEGMRYALLKGYTLRQLLPNITVLSLFSLVMLPVGLACFHFAVRKAKSDGTLTQF
ncbi:MAG: ABC transporter permease [Candidatus Schekmanbacteria bacterium]|nr:ABC transporter permease [Candidatus Schekmanbacteria bacterium]